eukprot:988689-Rhodomonas_salina.1
MSDHDDSHGDGCEKQKALATLEGRHNFSQLKLVLKSESMRRKFSFIPKGGQKTRSQQTRNSV